MTKTETMNGGKNAVRRANNLDAILEAAREVFTEMGFGATSVRDITRRSGLASGTFYNYFSGKEAVFEALVDNMGNRLRPMLRQVRHEATNFEDFFEGSFYAYFSYYAENRADYALLRSNRDREGGHLSGPQIRAGLAELKEDIEHAIQEGILPEIDVDYLAAAISGSVFAILDRMMMRQPPNPNEAAKFVTRLYLDGIKRMKN